MQSYDLYYLSKEGKKELTFASLFFYFAPGRTNPHFTPIRPAPAMLESF
jgi:hypothetical protein